MRRPLFYTLAAISCLFQGACVQTTLPYVPATGDLSEVGPALNSYSQATVPKAGLVTVEGDGLAYGVVERSKSAHAGVAGVWQAQKPFPEVLNALLGVRVENRGLPGQTLVDGEHLWGTKPCGNLLVLAYGYSDALKGVKSAEFADALARRVAEAHAQGAAVILLAPPHFKSKRMERGAETERAVMKAAQNTLGVGFVDLAPTVAKIDPRPLTGAYQSQDVYKSIAYAVAAYIAVAPEAGSPTSPARPLTSDP